MAAAMNAIGFDAAAIGNHEFNYGIETLRKFQSQLHHPLLCANALDWNTGAPAFPEFVIKKVRVCGPGSSADHRHDDGNGEYVKVGIVGLVTPGCAIWDKANLDGRIKFNGIVEQAKIVIPKVKAAGADIVVVSCHSGVDTSSSYGDALPWPENASTLLAQQVPGIDAILVGHAHLEIPQRFVTNTATGKQVLLSEPLKWGERLTVMDLNLVKERGRWTVGSSSATVLNANTVGADDKIVSLVAEQHAKVRSYVNSVIGTSTAAMSAATSRYEDTAAMDFINYVQADAVKKALAGSPSAGLPILSIAAPFNAAAAIPAGNVTVRDVAGLYIFDNTLLGIVFTGAQVRAYLEFSASLLQADQRHRPVHPGPAHQRRHADRAGRHPGLQLRHHGRAGRAADLRHRHRPAGRLADQEPGLRRRPAERQPAVRDRDQQLPAVRRRQLPRRQDRAGGLQRPGRDPAADHRLGDGGQGDRPVGVRLAGLEAGLQRPADPDQRLSG